MPIPIGHLPIEIWQRALASADQPSGRWSCGGLGRMVVYRSSPNPHHTPPNTVCTSAPAPPATRRKPLPSGSAALKPPAEPVQRFLLGRSPSLSRISPICLIEDRLAGPLRTGTPAASASCFFPPSPASSISPNTAHLFYFINQFTSPKHPERRMKSVVEGFTL